MLQLPLPHPALKSCYTKELRMLSMPNATCSIGVHLSRL